MASYSKHFKNTVTNRILAMKFASEFILIWPLFLVMFAERGHISAAGIGTIVAIELILTIVFEIPTGIVADRFPRKYVLIASLLAKLSALLIWWEFATFHWYLIAGVFMALGISLESGSIQAYLYGTLDDTNKQSFGRFWARVNSMVMISYTTAFICTALVGPHYKLLVGLSIIPILVAIVIGLSLPVDMRYRSVETDKPRIFGDAVRHILNSRQLLKLLLTGVLVVTIAEIIINLTSLYYKQIGVANNHISLWFAGGNIFGAISFWMIHSWEKTLDKYKLLFTFLATLALVASFYGGTFLAASGAIVYLRWFRMLQVQYDANLQHLSSDHTRATIASIGNFAALVLAATSVFLIGLFAVDNNIVRPMRIALLIITAVFFAVHGLIRYKRRANSQSSLYLEL